MRLAATIAGLGLGACSSDVPLDWTYSVPDPSSLARIARWEARIVRGGCPADGAADLAYLGRFDEGGAPRAPDVLAAGTYGFVITGLDAGGALVAEGCTRTAVPTRSVHVVVGRGGACAPPSACDDASVPPPDGGTPFDIAPTCEGVVRSATSTALGIPVDFRSSLSVTSWQCPDALRAPSRPLLFAVGGAIGDRWFVRVRGDVAVAGSHIVGIFVERGSCMQGPCFRAKTSNCLTNEMTTAFEHSIDSSTFTVGLYGNGAAHLDVVKMVCGNGTREEGEPCEDSNTTSGDGCSADCRVELPAGPTAMEVEPNDEPMTASLVTLAPGATTTLSGDLGRPCTDFDMFAVDVESGGLEITSESCSPAYAVDLAGPYVNQRASRVQTQPCGTPIRAPSLAPGRYLVVLQIAEPSPPSYRITVRRP